MAKKFNIIMLKSMTAFGRSRVNYPLGHFLVEIQSVNKKYLDITVSLPKELSRFENDVKKWIGTKINRGLVNVKISARFENSSPVSVKANSALALQIVDAWKELADDLSIPKDISINLLSQYEDILIFDANIQNEEEHRKALKQAVEQAMADFIKMREAEGAELVYDISSRLSLLKELIDQIELKTPDASKKYRQKLMERIQELLSGSAENEERVLREVAVFAEKVDVSEELVRFRSHMKQFEELMASNQESVGRTLDFLLQELNREANTIGSKSMDAAVSQFVVKIKSELEKIREQIQNLE